MTLEEEAVGGNAKNGTGIPRFELCTKVASAGYGELWIGYDQVLCQKVAIKRIHKWWTSNPGYEQTIKREVLSGRQITSPHVVKIYDLVKINRQDCLIMEYVEGPTLAAMMQNASPSSTERVRLGRELCLGLIAVHSANLAHCDLKPDNVIVTPDGRLVIIDLGMSALSSQKKPITFDQYQAPEFRIPPSKILADIYSLGGLLVLITGRSNGKPARPETRLLRVAYKCLSAEPGKRYSSVKDVLRAVDHSQSWVSQAVGVVNSSRSRLSFTCLMLAEAIGKTRLSKRQSRISLSCLIFLGLLSAYFYPRVTSNVPLSKFLVNGSSDPQSAMFADLIGIYLESQHMLVSRAPTGTDAQLLPKPPAPAEFSVIDVSLIPGDLLRVTLPDSKHFHHQTLQMPASTLSATKLLATISTHLGFPPPVQTWDYGIDGYTQTAFADAWHSAMSGVKTLPAPTCDTATSIPAQLLRARQSLLLFAADKSESSRLCAVAAMDGLEAQLTTSQVAIGRARLLRIEGNTPEAVRLLRLATKRLPTKGPLYRVLGEMALQGGFETEAIGLAQQAISADPFSSQNYVLNAKAYLAEGRDDEAAEILAKALRIDDHSGEIYATLGAAYIKTGRFREAKAALEHAIEISPNSDTQVVLGLSNLLCGYTAQGVLILSGAAAAHPTVYSYATLGAAYRWSGDVDKAKGALTTALGIGRNSSKDPSELGRLAMVNAQLHNGAQADRLIAEAEAFRSSLTTELIYDSLIVDAFANRKKECARKFQLLQERRFPMALLLKDPQVSTILERTR